jgi:predicted RNase H-like nuclease
MGPPIVFIGFDSAWADNPKEPGAICATGYEGGRFTTFVPPELASFDHALEFIQAIRSREGVTIVAIDQPTIVANASGGRPVERVAGSLISWIGGGVQPANRRRIGMFDDDAPIWRFLTKLAGVQKPEQSRTASAGLFVIEVFPALALPSIDPTFLGRLEGPRYNPQRRKTFRVEHWSGVVNAVAQEAQRLGVSQLPQWCENLMRLDRPRKQHQDLLDSAICLLVAIRWRLSERRMSIMIGDLSTGYMVAPVSEAARVRLEAAARERNVFVDGEMLGA